MITTKMASTGWTSPLSPWPRVPQAERSMSSTCPHLRPRSGPHVLRVGYEGVEQHRAEMTGVHCGFDSRGRGRARSPLHKQRMRAFRRQ